ncbi:hypothetical protein AB0G04_09520 [Actinoplanes sp. NPDC023801]|uniref:hypothetical protein n=1 Tax=Actinoplanes sp. NPDC023801 TaxID=3154595 RepID=UPI0033CCD955
MTDRNRRRPAHEDALQRLHVRIAQLPILGGFCAVFIMATGELTVVQLLSAVAMVAGGVCGVGVWLADRDQRMSDRLLAAALILFAIACTGLALGGR